MIRRPKVRGSQRINDETERRADDLEIGFCSLDLGSLAVGGRLQQLGGPLAGVNLTFSERFVL
jgi:8-hydroxy-5-deazaflavin:NADPH oxidoreductase